MKQPGTSDENISFAYVESSGFSPLFTAKLTASWTFLMFGRGKKKLDSSKW